MDQKDRWNQPQMQETLNRYHITLQGFLKDHLQRDSISIGKQRKAAQDKLSKLTKTQFHELATDVFDEIIRRQVSALDVPFLPVRPEFHPKRNQARQKLATLQVNKFKDLATDVLFELERRFPELFGEVIINEHSPSTSSLNNNNNNNKINNNSNNNLNAYSNNSNASLNAYPSGASPKLMDNSKQKQLSSRDDEDLESLDNMMQDLGNILKTKGGSKPVSPAVHQNNNASSDDVERLEEMVTEQKSIIEDQERIIKDIEQKHKSLLKKFEDQEKQTEKFRSEAEDLLEEIKLMTKKVEVLNSEREIDQANIKTLIDEKSSLSSKVKELEAEIKRLKTESVLSLTTSKTPSKGKNRLNLDYEMDKELVSNYLLAVDELQKAVRSNTASNILMAMKSIVVCVRAISESVDEFEGSLRGIGISPRSPSSISSYVQAALEKLVSHRNSVSTTLSNLITVAKERAKSSDEQSSVQAVDKSATGLTNAIVDLVELVKSVLNDSFEPSGSPVKKRVESTGDRDSELSPIRNSGSPSTGNGEKKATPQLRAGQLKVQLENDADNIVQLIQDMLQCLKSNDDGRDLLPRAQKIFDCCDAVIRAANTALTHPDFSRDLSKNAKYLIEDLEMYNTRLRTFFDRSSNDYVGEIRALDKFIKQKLAAASYDIAKSTKELVSVFCN